MWWEEAFVLPVLYVPPSPAALFFPKRLWDTTVHKSIKKYNAELSINRQCTFN